MLAIDQELYTLLLKIFAGNCPNCYKYRKLFTFQNRSLSEELEKAKKAERELDLSRAQCEGLEKRLEGTMDDLTKSRDAIKETEERADKLRENIVAMEADKNILLTKTASLKDDVDSKDKIIAEIQRKMTAELQNSEQATLQLQDRTAERDKATQRVKELTEEAERRDRTLNETKAKLEEAETDAKVCRRRGYISNKK